MNTLPFAITALYAGILGLLSVLLANQVLYVRLRAQQMPKWKDNAVIRVQANFVENVPLALVLLLLLELNGTPVTIMHIFGVALVICRALHAYGMSFNEGANYPRLIGAQGTFLLLSTMSVALIVGYVQL
ncbi:MAG: MAPEG family protein [Pseudomonadota bacterium]